MPRQWNDLPDSELLNAEELAELNAIAADMERLLNASRAARTVGDVRAIDKLIDSFAAPEIFQRADASESAPVAPPTVACELPGCKSSGIEKQSAGIFIVNDIPTMTRQAHLCSACVQFAESCGLAVTAIVDVLPSAADTTPGARMQVRSTGFLYECLENPFTHERRWARLGA